MGTRSDSGLTSHRDDIADSTIAILLPGGMLNGQEVSPRFKAKCEEDVIYHLLFLEEALRLEMPSLFEEYTSWAAVVLETAGLPPRCLTDSLDAMKRAIGALDIADAGPALEFLDRGTSAARDVSAPPETFLVHDAPYVDLAAHYLSTIFKGDTRGAKRAVLDEIENGSTIEDIYLHVLQPALHEVGRLWQVGRISVGTEHHATATTRELMSIVAQVCGACDHRVNKRIVVACVSQEQHDVGARMVVDMFEKAGWDTIYMGANTPAESIAAAIRDFNADLLGISTTIASNLSETS